MALTEFQQHLLNYFKLTHASSNEDLKKIFEQIKEKLFKNECDNSITLLGEVNAINKTLKEFNLTIVETIDEFTSEKLFILVNTSFNNILQQLKFYDKNSISLLSEIIRECILSSKGNVKETYCLNLNSQIGTSKAEIQCALENLIKEKWLVSRVGIISLGMRTIIELEQNLKESFPDDIQNCPLCKHICIQGFICDKCYTKYHFYCIKKYANASKHHPKCPTCREDLENLELPLNFKENVTDLEQIDFFGAVPSKRRRKLDEEYK